MTDDVRTIDGVEYLTGTAGSLILACDQCGEEHFREALPTWEYCFTCPGKHRVQAIRVDEIETKWKPLWRKLGHDVLGDPCAICGEPWSYEHAKEKHPDA